MYEEALCAEHSDPKRYKKLISDASVLGHIDAQLRYGKELVRGGNKVDGLKWLCCTNRLMAELPLSLDRVILRLP